MEIKLLNDRFLIQKRLLFAIMRIFVFLLCTTVFSFTSEYSFAQEKVYIKQDQIASVDQVFKIIKKQTNYRFIYPKKLFKDAPKVNLKKGEVFVQELLNQSISTASFNFQLTDNNTIVVKENSNPVQQVVPQQQHQVNGTVVDQEGLPLLGANILEKGTSNGVQTDFDGNFALNVSSANATIVISYIGFETQEIPLNGQTTISVTLKESASQLDEVVVIGYGTKTKATLTGAVETIGTQELESRPSANIVNSIQGAVPGLLVTRSSGQLGNEGNAFNIRGAVSRDPIGVLTIIDGIPQRSLGTGAIESLNPDDIESFTVLKDAQAAIYGSRGAGGVILITTKKGKSDKPQIRYTSNLSINTVGNFLRRTTVKQHFEMFSEAWNNDGIPNHPFAAIEDLVANSDPNNPEIIPGPFSDTPTLWTGHNEWMETMWGTSIWQNHNLAISGSTDRSNYFTSFRYLDQESQLQFGANSNKVLGLRLKYDYDIIKDKFKLGTNIVMDEQTTITPNRYVAMLGAMQAIWTSAPAFTPGGNFYHFGGFNSPNGFAELGGEDELIRRNISIQFNTEFKPIEELTITGQFATVKEFDERRDLQRIFRFYQYDDTPGNFGAQRNRIDRAYGTSTRNTANLFVNYDKSIGDHNFGLMVGTSHEEDFDSGFSAFRNDLSNEDFPYLVFGDPEEQFNSGFARNILTIKSYFSRLSYDYQGKYLFEGNFRNDRSSRFAAGFRDGYFPGASVGWVASKEDFVKNLSDKLSYLKLRLSWGELGNQNNVGSHDHISRISIGGAPLFGPNGSPVLGNSASIGALADPNRSWETVEIKNIGIDFAFFNSRLSGSFDYFDRNTKDILIALTYPEVLGINPVRTNGGEIEAKGYELSLGWKDNIGDFNYFVRGTLNNDTNKVTKIGTVNPASRGVNAFVKGYSTGAMFGYDWGGFLENQQQAEQLGLDTGFGAAVFSPGDVRLNDIDGDGVYRENALYVEGDPDSGDLIYLGDSRPHDIFSATLGFDYKGFDFSAFFQGVGRWKVFTVTQGIHTAIGGDWWNQPFAYQYGKQWSPDRPNATLPRLTSNGGIDGWNYEFSNAPYATINNAYVRLKNLQLGYSLPSKVLDKIGVNKLRLYFSGVDLFEITNKDLPDGSDPERPFAISFTPFTRSYSVGIDLTF